MGFYKEKLFEKPAINEFLEQIVDRLENPARGITLQVIDQGVDSLSAKQEWIFEARVLESYTLEHCTDCFHSIPWSEMAFALENGGRCSWCYNRWQKSLEE